MIQRKIRRKQSYNEANEKECKKINKILMHCKKVYAIVEHYPHVITFDYTGLKDKDGMPIIWDFREIDWNKVDWDTAWYIWKMKRLDEVFLSTKLVDWFFDKEIAQTFLDFWTDAKKKKD